MIVALFRRRFGVHTFIKEVEIPGSFADYTVQLTKEGDYFIDEQSLLHYIPHGFLPIDPEKILLTIGYKWGSRGQYGLIKFLDWAKYFDSYIVELESFKRKNTSPNNG